jgi:hypothetical protein
MHLSRVFGLQVPAAVATPLFKQHLDGGLHAFVIGNAGGPEIVECPKDVVTPAERIG